MKSFEQYLEGFVPLRKTPGSDWNNDWQPQSGRAIAAVQAVDKHALPLYNTLAALQKMFPNSRRVRQTMDAWGNFYRSFEAVAMGVKDSARRSGQQIWKVLSNLSTKTKTSLIPCFILPPPCGTWSRRGTLEVGNQLLQAITPFMHQGKAFIRDRIRPIIEEMLFKRYSMALMRICRLGSCKW